MALALFHCAVVFLLIVSTPPLVAGLEWWKNTIVYQIYPRSFMDSNGDGVGDLNGITSRLEYFNDIGVGTIWLSPVYKSPMADFGYDIADYKDIDSLFGTMADFGDLIEKAHLLGIKLVMDFVPNHSSDQHEWFIESKKNKSDDNRYRDYYVWVDPKQGCNDLPENCIPNNWVGVFGGSMWEWVPERGQFYLHQFLREQPDLNYRNSGVKEAMRDVVRFWLEKGVDGFRADAIRHLYENENLEDEPANPNYQGVPGERPQYDSLIHTKTADLSELHDEIYEWRKIFQEYSTRPENYRFLVTESYDNHKALLPYYGTPARPEADFPFNFGLIGLNKENLSGKKIHQAVDEWMKDLPAGKWPNWVIGNHDNSRISDRVGKDYARALNVLNLLLPGTPTTYYGEELAMEDIWVSLNDTQDPFALNNPSHWEKYTRDPERSPMQWDKSPNAGFSQTTGETWLPVNKNYLDEVNVADQKANKTSSLSLYMKLAALRKDEPAFHTNHLKYLIVHEGIFSFLRRPKDESLDAYLVIINAGTSGSTDDYVAALAKDNLKFQDNTGTVVISSNMGRNGETLEMNRVSVAVGEALVAKGQLKSSSNVALLSFYTLLATLATTTIKMLLN